MFQTQGTSETWLSKASVNQKAADSDSLNIETDALKVIISALKFL